MITDELREYAEDWGWLDMSSKEAQDQIEAIADRIDAEHEAKVSYWQDASYKDGYDEGFASADDWLGQHEDAMAEHGWVRLPVDADGVPWHIGDRTESGQEVKAMGLNSHGWCFVGTVNEINPSLHRHHQPDTWERIIEDATALGAQMGRRTTQVDDLVARCKALCERTKEAGE